MKTTATPNPPWTKGKLVGQKAPLRLREFGPSGYGYRSLRERGIWPFSI
jgi:hypothetical protein